MLIATLVSLLLSAFSLTSDVDRAHRGPRDAPIEVSQP